MVSHPHRRFAAVLFVPWLLAGALAGPPSLTMEPGGVAIDAGTAGRFTLEPPQLMRRRDAYDAPKPALTVIDAAHATAHYPDGTEIQIEVDGSRVRYAYGPAPSDAHGLRFSLLVPIRFGEGGAFSFGGSDWQRFPAAKDRQFLYQGESSPLRLRAPSGDGFSLRTPKGWQEMQDNRFFDWPVFCYLFTYEFKAHPGASSLEIDVGEEEKTAGTAGKFLVDQFGQPAGRAYPEKITGERDLRDDAVREAKELDAPAGADRDPYGGLPGSGEKFGLKKTGFFHLARAGGRDVLVTPEGNAFFQLGVCSLQPQDDHTLVRGRERVFEWLPPRDGPFAGAWLEGHDGVFSFYVANWIRKAGAPFDLEKWLAQATARLRRWGFNSSGAFSGRIDAARAPTFPCTPMLPLETWMTPGLKAMQGVDRMYDPFAPGTEEVIDRAFAEKVAPHAGNPHIIGYFLGNEQLFENVPRLVPAQRGDSPSKRRLVQMLGEKYSWDIGKFNAAWAPPFPFTRFEQLADAALPVATPTAQADMQDFLRLYLEAHYATVARLFRKHDPHHLLLGSRWQPGTANREMLAKIAGRHVDVISVNYYTYAIEPEFLRRIHEWSGRPLLLSEWHFTSGERGMAGLKEVAGQPERGLAYRNYAEAAAALPCVVGVQWFSYVDQAVTGRWFEGFNGEAANIGLVDVADRPYAAFIAECRKTNEAVYDVMLGGRPPFRLDDPRFTPKAAGPGKVLAIPRALPGFTLDATTRNWPGRPPEALTPQSLVLGPPDPDFAASFRLCWDDACLYVIAEVTDKTPQANRHEGKDLWQGDAVELFVGPSGLSEAGPLRADDRQILLGAGPRPAHFVVNASQPPEGIRVLTAKDASGAGYVIAAALPWTALGITPQPGREFLFDLAVDNAGDDGKRAHQWVWNGSDRNSSDRTGWGRARLSENEK